MKKPRAKRKPSDVLFEAATRIATGRERFACEAIIGTSGLGYSTRTINILHSNREIPRALLYLDLLKPTGKNEREYGFISWCGWFGIPNEVAQSERLLALSFAIAIAKSNGE